MGYKDDDDDDHMITNRKVAVGICTIGVMEVFVATFAAICSFVMFGGFCENLDCGEIHNGIGFWLAFPLMIPGILGVIVLATRHQKASLTFLITNIAVLILSIAHTIIVWQDYDDFWDSHKDNYDAGNCAPNGFTGCSCAGRNYPYQCNMIKFGYELNWILFGLSITTIVLCVLGGILGLLGACIMTSVQSKRSR